GVQPQAAVVRAIDRRRSSHYFGGTAGQGLYHDGLLRSVRTGDDVREAEPPATWIEGRAEAHPAIGQQACLSTPEVVDEDVGPGIATDRIRSGREGELVALGGPGWAVPPGRNRDDRVGP